ncbi:SRPBCC family protein [Halobacillus yeomjeoni]|uniref:SRPBCC family protein n=1 Tax=Halobacillus yeomjeoni TaxID=311194 RepID=A0A931HYX4_9BACI|nr:SRPBCC family protein [Halobacillus yeomjeoni]MBH0231723.1 SRPBCC family protein [Halobacillus yeomjeoni]MCA0984954.1 SRPBCC family protein [Halobacillus yeomjeoni]
MIQWKEKKLIEADIETVWRLFAEENMYKIMPKVVENTPLEVKDEVIGSTFRQSYKEGKRTETYIVEIIGYEDGEDKKFKRIAFTLAKLFKIDLSFTLLKQSAEETLFIYEGRNEGVGFIGRMMTKLGSKKAKEKVVKEFMQRVEKEAVQSKETSNSGH